MSTPIGIGSRFRVLTGDYRGREGAIVGVGLGRPEWWRIDLGEGEIVEVSPVDLAMLQRLADTPPAPDAMLLEIEAAARAVDLEAIGQVGGIVDAIRDNLDDGGDAESDDDWFASRRIVFADVAALCLAGLRAIDRRAK